MVEVIIVSKFSDMLVYLRKRDKLSQQELADKIGMSRSVVGMYESDQRMPSFEVLEAIADTFNVNIDFLVGHIDSGTYSQIFRNNLAKIIENQSGTDIAASNINDYEIKLIINGSIPLTFDCACELADQLGETLDSMLGNKKSATQQDDGLSEIAKIFTELSPDNRSKLLELSRLYLNAQRSIGEKK